jgi:SAM-dependent methyltransferase
LSHRKVEDKVLGIYRRFNPSKTQLESKQNAIDFYQTRLNILGTLGLTPQFFKDKKIIDIGGGSGEKSICYALWGADVTIIEPNEISCKLAQNLFSKLDLQDKLQVENIGLYDLEMNKLKDFDIIICEAVLHHTYNPIKGLDRILKNMNAGQTVLIALGEKHGTFKRDLQRKLISKLSNNDEKKIIEISKKYFKTHIERAMKHILREENAVIYDNFVNPQDKPSSLEEICNTFKKNNVNYLSSYPKLELFNLTIPWSQKRIDFYDYDYYKNYYKLLEKIWMTCGEEEVNQDLENFNTNQIIKRVENDEKKLLELERKIEDGSFEDDELKIIQKGYMGVGANFFVGFKSDNKFSEKFLSISNDS